MTKYIATADWHLSDKATKNRKADYPELGLAKVEQIFMIAEEENASGILLVGDMFDKSSVSLEYMIKVANIFRAYYDIPVISIPGNHDLKYHSMNTLMKTSYGFFYTAGLTEMLDEGLAPFNDEVFGIPWEGALADPEKDMPVMMVHEMVTSGGPLFPGQEGYTEALSLMKRYPNARVVLSGDNHKPHVYQNKRMPGRIQINCGSIMRKSKSEMNYKPAVWLFDTDDEEFVLGENVIEIPLKIEEDVWDFTKIEMDEKLKASKDELQEFLSLLGETATKPDFESVLAEVVHESGLNENVLNIINDIMAKVTK